MYIVTHASHHSEYLTYITIFPLIETTACICNPASVREKTVYIKYILNILSWDA